MGSHTESLSLTHVSLYIAKQQAGVTKDERMNFGTGALRKDDTGLHAASCAYPLRKDT